MRLLPHASPAPAWVRRFTAEVSDAGRQLNFTYCLEADLAKLRIPAVAAPERTDDLWRRTCFEAFVASTGSPAYGEFNFSPSGQWAAYAFTGHRSGMRLLPVLAPPRMEWRHNKDRLELAVQVGLDDLQGVLAGWPLRIGLTAVLEDQSGTMSHWALHHPHTTPDFHSPESFTLEIQRRR